MRECLERGHLRAVCAVGGKRSGQPSGPGTDRRSGSQRSGDLPINSQFPRDHQGSRIGNRIRGSQTCGPRKRGFLNAAIGLLIPLGGCTPQLESLLSGQPIDADSSLSGNTTVAGITLTSPDAVLRGDVRGAGDFEMFDLGPGEGGDEWSISPAGLFSGRAFTLVLFDAEDRLLARGIVASGSPLTHILRRSTATVKLGVMPVFGTAGGSFEFQTRIRAAVGAPGGRPQRVYLNFSGGENVQVHVRDGISFDAFDGTMLGAVYAGETEVIRNAIVETIRADYAPYEVAIATSAEGPPPEEPYSTIHFGGRDPGLLGLADNVDAYNSQAEQTAVVYIESFADFARMGLSANDIGLMIGNVGSHELGHLLGLYHTREPDDIMDTTGTAWDLAEAQEFSTAALEPSVFPTGFEDSAMLLEDGVGRRSDTPAARIKSDDFQKKNQAARMRKLAADQLRGRCGNCVHPD